MYLVVYYTGGTGATALIVYGPFSSQAAAQAFVNSQTNSQFYSVAQAYPPPPYPAGSTPQFQNVPAGQYVLAQATTNLTGGSQILLYGPFASAAAANAYVAGQQFRSGYQACIVQPGS